MFSTLDQRPYGTPPGKNFKDKEERKKQPVDYFVVLDLEGKQEVLEFPAALINTETLEIEDIFHRYVRPLTFSEDELNEYLSGKYQQPDIIEAWFEEALPFTEVLMQFNDWLGNHGLLNSILRNEQGETAGDESPAPYTFSFISCGNWGIKTQIPRQCAITKLDMPGYFHEWTNLKDVYLNFYKHKALGMRSMLAGLDMEPEGQPHSGKGDVCSICKIVVRMVNDGVLMEPTAKRAVKTGYVSYKYQYRV